MADRYVSNSPSIFFRDWPLQPFFVARPKEGAWSSPLESGNLEFSDSSFFPMFKFHYLFIYIYISCISLDILNIKTSDQHFGRFEPSTSHCSVNRTLISQPLQTSSFVILPWYDCDIPIFPSYTMYSGCLHPIHIPLNPVFHYIPYSKKHALLNVRRTSTNILIVVH